MWENIKAIIRKLFGITIPQEDEEIQRNRRDAANYQEIESINFTAIFAEVLSSLAFSDSSVSVSLDGDTTKRTELLDETLQRVWKNIKQNIAVGNGCGMIVSLPYSAAGPLGHKIYVDTVSKDRVFITGTQGDDITAVTVLSDFRTINNNRYCRWTNYKLEGDTYIIEQSATRNSLPCPLTAVPDWAYIDPVTRIANVTRLPLGIYRCPTGNRRANTLTGVPITFGCDDTIRKIRSCLAEIEKEFKNKKVKIFADTTMFDKHGTLDSDVYKSIMKGGKLSEGSLIQIFDPAFRDTSYFNRLEHYFALLEKQVGTSRGILTDLQTSGATATEIRRATFQTFALCDDIHTNAEEYIRGLVYGVNVLANYYSLTPPSDYQINFDWSYSLIEDSTESFNELVQGKSFGAISTTELRQFLKPEETKEQAQAAVDEIKADNPTMSQLIGD